MMRRARGLDNQEVRTGNALWNRGYPAFVLSHLLHFTESHDSIAPKTAEIAFVPRNPNPDDPDEIREYAPKRQRSLSRAYAKAIRTTVRVRRSRLACP